MCSLADRTGGRAHFVELARRLRAARSATLAAAISMRGFLALFPLVLLGLAVVGFVAAGVDDLATRLVNQLGLEGEAARTVTDAVEAARAQRVTSSVVALAGLLWTGTGLAAALADAWDQVWDVPRRPLDARARGLVWLAGGTPLAAVSMVATGLGTRGGVWLAVGAGLGVAATASVLAWTALVLPARRCPVAATLPAVTAGALALEAAKIAGAMFLPPLVGRASTTYGTIGVSFAILVWFLLLGRIVVAVAVLERFLADGRHPPAGTAG